MVRLTAVGQPATTAPTAAAKGPEGELRKQARTVLDRITVAKALAPTSRLKFKDASPAEAIRAGREVRLALGLHASRGRHHENSHHAGSRQRYRVEALDRMCNTGGLSLQSTAYYQGMRSPTLVVSNQAQQQIPIRGYAGPFRLQVVSGECVRGFNFFTQSTQTYDNLHLQLMVLKEPHVRLVSFLQTPRITEGRSRDQKGQSLLPASQPNSYSQGFGEASIAYPLYITLKSPDRPNDKLTVLRGVLPLEVMTESQDLVTVPRPAASKGKMFRGQKPVIMLNSSPAT